MQSKIEFASEEERFFHDWIIEGIENGLIKEFIYQPKPFILCESVKLEKSGGKNKLKPQHIMYGHEYQADFLVVWTQLALQMGLIGVYEDSPYVEGVFIAHRKNSLIYSVFDVKGGFTGNINDTRFPLNQKWVHAKYKIYVNKAVPYSSVNIKKCVFSETWTPLTYLFRKKKRQEGFLKLYCIPKTITEYLKP